MKVRTHEEMFLDVDRNGQFIPGIAPPEKNATTFRQTFEKNMEKKLSEFKDISYLPSSKSFLQITGEIIKNQDSDFDRAFFGKLRDIVWSGCSMSEYYLSYKRLSSDVRIYYIGEFPKTYYENAHHIKKQSQTGELYSTTMDVFYMLALEVSERHGWDLRCGYIQEQIAEEWERLKEDKPGLFASKKKPIQVTLAKHEKSC